MVIYESTVILQLQTILWKFDFPSVILEVDYFLTRVIQNRRDGPGAKQFRRNQILMLARISLWGTTDGPTD
jgi:hypothetical protein